jgi:hypothetical protein
MEGLYAATDAEKVATWMRPVCSQNVVRYPPGLFTVHLVTKEIST